MNTNQRLVEMIASFESFRAEAYVCPGGKMTIGYGTTTHRDGTPILKGENITRDEAMARLQEDVGAVRDEVQRAVIWHAPEHVIDACASLAYNIGLGAFDGSTCLKRLNAGDLPGAAEALRWWNQATDPRTGKKRVLGGLVARRESEADLLLNGWDGTAGTTAAAIEEKKPTLTKSRTVWSVLVTAGSGLGPILVALWPEISARAQGLDTNAIGQMSGQQMLMSVLGIVGGAVFAVVLKKRDFKDGNFGSQGR